MSMDAESRSKLTPFAPGTTKYAMLGVSDDATEVDMKVAYRRAALLFHPDRHPEAERPMAEQIFKDISSAYRTLSNAEQRRLYDQALRGGYEFRESGTAEGVASLATILAEIQGYASIFSRDQLAKLDTRVIEVVVDNLIDSLGEQVVEVYPLTQSPVHSSHQGQFKSGAVVLTNLRVLMPFTYEWQETSGNVMTKYTGLQVPNAAWPLITRLHITVRRRLSTDILVEIEQADSSVAFKAGRQNLSELLLIASLWGVKSVVDEEDSRRVERRSALLRPWQVAMWTSVVTLVVTGIIGFFTDDGFFGLPIALVSWASQKGLAQALVLLTTLWSSRRLMRWITAYRPRSLPQMVRDASPSTPGAPGPLVNVA